MKISVVLEKKKFGRGNVTLDEKKFEFYFDETVEWNPSNKEPMTIEYRFENSDLFGRFAIRDLSFRFDVEKGGKKIIWSEKMNKKSKTFFNEHIEVFQKLGSITLEIYRQLFTTFRRTPDGFMVDGTAPSKNVMIKHMLYYFSDDLGNPELIQRIFVELGAPLKKITPGTEEESIRSAMMKASTSKLFELFENSGCYDEYVEMKNEGTYNDFIYSLS